MAISTRVSPLKGYPADQDKFWKSFREHVFTLIYLGYQRLDRSQYHNLQEPDISGDLVSEIQNVLDDRTSPRWTSRFAIHDDPAVRNTARKGKRRKRIDIEIESTTPRPRPRYSFEAKRLCAGTHGIGIYLGQNGLGEFISGNYSQNSDEAAMLGYIQSNTLDYWEKKLMRGFQKNASSLHICTDGSLINNIVIDIFKYSYLSKHDRPSIGKPIRIFHLFLDFCSS